MKVLSLDIVRSGGFEAASVMVESLLDDKDPFGAILFSFYRRSSSGSHPLLKRHKGCKGRQKVSWALSVLFLSPSAGKMNLIRSETIHLRFR